MGHVLLYTTNAACNREKQNSSFFPPLDVCAAIYLICALVINRPFESRVTTLNVYNEREKRHVCASTNEVAGDFPLPPSKEFAMHASTLLNFPWTLLIRDAAAEQRLVKCPERTPGKNFKKLTLVSVPRWERSLGSMTRTLCKVEAKRKGQDDVSLMSSLNSQMRDTTGLAIKASPRRSTNESAHPIKTAGLNFEIVCG